MKKLILFIFYLFCFYTFNGQDIIKRKSSIDIFLLLNGFAGDYVTNSSGIQTGIELQMKKNLGVQLALQYIFDVPAMKNTGYFVVHVDDLKGYAVGMNVKRYYHIGNNLQKGYMGGSLKYVSTNAVREDYRVKRDKLGVYGITGWKYCSVSGFLIEVTAGVGAQIISSSATIDKNNYYLPKEFPWFKDYTSGTGIYPDLLLELKIGWRIIKNKL